MGNSLTVTAQRHFRQLPDAGAGGIRPGQEGLPTKEQALRVNLARPDGAECQATTFVVGSAWIATN